MRVCDKTIYQYMVYVYTSVKCICVNMRKSDCHEFEEFLRFSLFYSLLLTSSEWSKTEPTKP